MNQKNGISGTCVSYVDHNAGTIDRWIEEGWEWGRPISHEEFEEARNGRLSGTGLQIISSDGLTLWALSGIATATTRFLLRKRDCSCPGRGRTGQN